MKRPIQVELNYSESGCPLFIPGDKAKLVIEVQESDIDPTGGTLLSQVELSGNKQGLIDLASAILALAESSESHHRLHLDDLYEGVVNSSQGLWLTIIKLPDEKSEVEN